MKTNQTKGDKWRVTGGKTTAVTRKICSCHASRVTRHFSAFTLIELLAVITIIGVLAAFTITVAGVVKKKQYVSQTQAEMGKLESAIDGYKDHYGFYPPSSTSGDSRVSQLYYELMGTTKDAVNYTTLDNSTQIKITDVPTAFPGVSGFVNCTKGSGEDATPARSFLSGLKPNQFGYKTNGTIFPVAVLLGAAGGPDLNYQPFLVSGMNPWRYVCPGTNNPNSYDLWMQLSISGKTNLICNWNTQPQTGSPLP